MMLMDYDRIYPYLLAASSIVLLTEYKHKSLLAVKVVVGISIVFVAYALYVALQFRDIPTMKPIIVRGAVELVTLLIIFMTVQLKAFAISATLLGGLAVGKFLGY